MKIIQPGFAKNELRRSKEGRFNSSSALHPESTQNRMYAKIPCMAATVEISVPESLIKALGSRPEELPRQTFEALIVQAYRKGRITHAEVGELLGLDRWETDGFLKGAQAFRPNESEEFSSDLERLRKIAK